VVGVRIGLVGEDQTGLAGEDRTGLVEVARTGRGEEEVQIDPEVARRTVRGDQGEGRFQQAEEGIG